LHYGKQRRKPNSMILMIDNYDSFTYNLVQFLGELGQELVVKRNDQTTIEEIERLQPKFLMISPGPCSPNEAGISLKAIEYFAGRIPILGVCLGHQSIAQVFNGDVVRADRLMHGKTSEMFHDGKTISFINCKKGNLTRMPRNILLDRGGGDYGCSS
jgi:para-aminobenzoate synthetase component II